MEDTQATKPKLPRTKKYMLVRYSRMRLLGLFEHNESHIPTVSAQVVVKTDKGLELGSIVGQLCAYRAGQLKLADDQIKKYFDDSEIPFSAEPAGRFVRYATPEDINEDRHFQKIASRVTLVLWPATLRECFCSLAGSSISLTFCARVWSALPWRE